MRSSLRSLALVMPVAIAAIRCATPVDRAVRAIPLSVMTHLRQNAQWASEAEEIARKSPVFWVGAIRHEIRFRTQGEPCPGGRERE